MSNIDEKNQALKLLSVTLPALSSTLIFDWKWKLTRRTFTDVFSTSTKQLLKQRRKNYVDSTSMNQCCFNVKIWLKLKVEPTYVYRRCFNVDKTTLKQHWKNYVNSMSMAQCCFNVDIWLKMKIEWTYVHRCCFDVEKTALKQLCQLLHWSVLMFTRKWLKNKTKLSFQE